MDEKRQLFTTEINLRFLSLLSKLSQELVEVLESVFLYARYNFLHVTYYHLKI